MQNYKSIHRTLAWTAVLAVLTIFSTRTHASWAYVPQEIRIMQADLVVVGKIAKTAQDFARDGRTYAVGVLKPTSVLKGKPMKNADIRVAWPAPRAGGIGVSTDITYRVGQEGVWVLSADEKRPVYWARYPSDYQPLDKLAEVKQKVANVKNLKWGERKNGLQVGMVVEQKDLRNSKVKINGRPVKAIARLSVYPLVKNAGNKSMHVVSGRPARPISLNFTGPAGKPIDVKLYGNRRQGPAHLRERNFIKLPPGKVRSLPYGLTLPTLTEPGVYSIQLTYQNKRDARDLKIDSVWKGAATSPEMKVDVPAKSN